MSNEPDLNWMISADDHLFEPPDVWTSEAPSSISEQVPRVVYEDDVMYWEYDGKRKTVPDYLLMAGRPAEDIKGEPIRSYSELNPGYTDSVARLEDMNRDGILASLCFPFFPRFCGQQFWEASDRDVAMWCVQRWNDWSRDEWAGNAPGRYIPMMILPLWDPNAAAKEIERCAALGTKAIAFSENPARLGLPSYHNKDRYWDPVFRAANDTQMPLAIHFGSSSFIHTTSDDAPMAVTASLMPMNLAYCFTDVIFSGILQRFPNLKLVLSEGGIGWIPYIIERCETLYRNQSWMQDKQYVYSQSGIGEAHEGDGFKFDRTPKELFRDHIFGSTIDDRFGAKNLEEIGFDNVVMEADYPHGDGTYPRTIENAHTMLDGYSAEVKYKLMQGNAKRLFRLENLPNPADLVPAGATS